MSSWDVDRIFVKHVTETLDIFSIQLTDGLMVKTVVKEKVSQRNVRNVNRDLPEVTDGESKSLSDQQQIT